MQEPTIGVFPPKILGGGGGNALIGKPPLAGIQHGILGGAGNQVKIENSSPIIGP